MLRFTLALLLGGLATAPAFAQQIVKCTDTNGRIEYRNSACPSGTRREAVEVSNLSIIEAERRAVGRDRRADESARALQTVPAGPQSQSQPLLAPGSDRVPANGGTTQAPGSQR